MPGRGRIVPRTTSGEAANAFGERGFDAWLNDRVRWTNIPEPVWEYTLGGYQVLKKWLSYREADVLGRSLHPAEARQFSEIARRIAAILLLGDELNVSYTRCSTDTYHWQEAVKRAAPQQSLF